MLVPHHRYDVIGITETHLDNTICNNELLFHGFHPPVRKDRNRFGGGLLFHISLELHFVIRDDLNNHSIEIMWCEIHNLCKKIKNSYLA